MKPLPTAAERNREPILGVLQQWLIAPGKVLEIGAGTGQHAVYFAQHFPDFTWLATDRAENLDGIRLWFDESRLPNLPPPQELDVRSAMWPAQQVQYVFSANTAHIMGWGEVEAMFAGIGRVLQPQGVFCLYGPFNRDGAFTSESNRAFDEALRSRDPQMGVRDDRALIALGRSHRLTIVADHPLPANNRLLVWVRDEG